MAGERSLTLSIFEDGHAIAQYADQLRSLVNDVALIDGQLSGRFLGDIDTPDWGARRHHLHFDVRVRNGDVLDGALMAISPPLDSGAPGKRMGNALNHWTRLERVKR